MDDWQYQPARDLHLPPTQRWRSLQRESGLFSRCSQSLWWATTHAYLSIAHRLKIDGRQHIPLEPPFVMVANHTSHLDVFCLAAVVPMRLRQRLLPIAAGDTFFETHLHARLATLLLNALPMWRHNCGLHALKTLRKRLIDDRCVYILFPEGTRSRDGTMGSFRDGLGMLIAASPVPVVPCYLDGAFDALPPGARWPRPRSLTLRIGKPLQFEQVTNRRAGWQTVCTELESAVRSIGPT